MLKDPSDGYRTEKLFVRDTDTRELLDIDATPYQAIQSLPLFMYGWASVAKAVYGPERVLTATVNVTDGCPIGKNSFCGEYCFAHLSWNGEGLRKDTPQKYIADTKRLREAGKGVSIFLSTDTEPFPGRGDISDVTYNLLKAMAVYPPDGLLVHSHTDTIGDQRYLDVMKDISQATNLIAGVGFDTDSDDLPEGIPPHFASIDARVKAFERMSASGIKTQASVTPLIGFRDFEGFGRKMHELGAYRVMVGELRKKFPTGGSRKAIGLDLGWNCPTEEEALTFFRELGFPGGVGLREDFYVLLP